MEAALGNSKEYTLKQYIAFASKLQAKAKIPMRSARNLRVCNRFDMNGPSSCLKKYSDPAFYRRSSGNSSLNDEKSKKERKARKAKKRRSWKRSTQLSFDTPPFSYNGSVKISSPPTVSYSNCINI